ncbi:MAG: DUF302 domain-containing protein [Holophaga sp.]|nr:DUF302 domain-containing protein [Holophaga sp.]
MAIHDVQVQRVSLTTQKPFHEVVARIDAAIGHPDPASLRRDTAQAGSYLELSEVVHRQVGPSGFMEFARFDLGNVLRKSPSGYTGQSLRLIVGNPLIMRRMVERVADAGSYAPVTILIDERADGVHVSYDRMASYLASYQDADALATARDLDAKVEALLLAAVEPTATDAG